MAPGGMVFLTREHWPQRPPKSEKSSLRSQHLYGSLRQPRMTAFVAARRRGRIILASDGIAASARSGLVRVRFGLKAVIRCRAAQKGWLKVRVADEAAVRLVRVISRAEPNSRSQLPSLHLHKGVLPLPHNRGVHRAVAHPNCCRLQLRSYV